MRVLNILAITLITLTSVVSGCKNSEKSAEKSKEEKTERTDGKLSQDEVVENPSSKAIAQPDRLQQENTATEDRPAPDYPDSLYFRMDRTPCFGNCPVFTVNVYRSGWALLKGGRFFDYEGYFSTKFSEEELNQIQKIAKDAGYQKLKHVYDAPVTDLPSSTTILNSEDIQHWVYNRMNAPDELRNFELEMETMIKDKQWTAFSKANQDVPE